MLLEDGSSTSDVVMAGSGDAVIPDDSVSYCDDDKTPLDRPSSSNLFGRYSNRMLLITR